MSGGHKCPKVAKQTRRRGRTTKATCARCVFSLSHTYWSCHSAFAAWTTPSLSGQLPPPEQLPLAMVTE